MKTRELIQQLNDADPTGELECCIKNSDISHVDVVPAYYDGTLELLVRDIDNPARVRSAIYETSGKKLRICPLSIEDVIFDDPDLVVQIHSCDEEIRDRLEASIASYRSKAKN